MGAQAVATATPTDTIYVCSTTFSMIVHRRCAFILACLAVEIKDSLSIFVERPRPGKHHLGGKFHGTNKHEGFTRSKLMPWRWSMATEGTSCHQRCGSIDMDCSEIALHHVDRAPKVR